MLANIYALRCKKKMLHEALFEGKGDHDYNKEVKRKLNWNDP